MADCFVLAGAADAEVDGAAALVADDDAMGIGSAEAAKSKPRNFAVSGKESESVGQKLPITALRTQTLD